MNTQKANHFKSKKFSTCLGIYRREKIIGLKLKIINLRA